MKYIFILAIAITVLIACQNNKENKIITADPVKVEKGKSTNSDAFNTSFEAVLKNYDALKLSFVNEDTLAINNNAKSLMIATDSIKMSELKIDESLINTAKQNASFISNNIKGLIGENGVEEKRRDFHLVSNDIFSLIRTVHYDKAIIYFQHCPMAFKNTGADWLSNSNEIINPYMPKKMLDCGINKDSVDFRSKK